MAAKSAKKREAGKKLAAKYGFKKGHRPWNKGKKTAKRGHK